MVIPIEQNNKYIYLTTLPDQEKILEEMDPIIWFLILLDLIYSSWDLYYEEGGKKERKTVDTKEEKAYFSFSWLNY